MALNIISNVQLDMKAPNTVIVYANQYDSAGSVRAQLLNSGESWAVPVGAKAVVMFKKSDNIGGFYDVTEFGVAAVEIDSDRSVIYINYDPQVLTTAGRVAVQINFYQNDQRLSSFAFYTDVQASAVTSGEIASSWLFNILSQEIAQTLTVATTPQAMTNWLEEKIGASIESGAYAIDDSLTVPRFAADAEATGKMVVVSDQNPNRTANKVWVKKTPATLEVPTMEDVDEVKSALNNTKESVFEKVDTTGFAWESGTYDGTTGAKNNTSNAIRLIDIPMALKGSHIYLSGADTTYSLRVLEMKTSENTGENEVLASNDGIDIWTKNDAYLRIVLIKRGISGDTSKSSLVRLEIYDGDKIKIIDADIEYHKAALSRKTDNIIDLYSKSDIVTFYSDYTVENNILKVISTDSRKYTAVSWLIPTKGETVFTLNPFRSSGTGEQIIRLGGTNDKINITWKKSSRGNQITVDVTGLSYLVVAFYATYNTKSEIGLYSVYEDIMVFIGDDAHYYAPYISAVDYELRGKIDDICSMDVNKSLANADYWEAGTIDVNTGKPVDQSKSIRNKKYIRTNGAAKYYRRVFYTEPDTTSQSAIEENAHFKYFYVYCYRKDYSYISRVVGDAISKVLSLPEDCAYVRCVIYTDISNANIDEIMPSTIDFYPADDEYFLPHYYDEYLEDKDNEINMYAKEAAVNGTVFFFVTDEHAPDYNENWSPAIIHRLSQLTNIPMFVSGGDLDQNGTKTQYYADLVRKNFTGHVYHVVGNHDFLSLKTGKNLYYDLDIFNRDQNGNNEHHYYYVDDPQTKMRYIFLAAFMESEAAMGTGSGTSARGGYTAEQKAWIRDEALSIPTGWTAIVFTHYFYMINHETKVSNLSYGGDILTMLANNPSVICVFQGHTHLDRIIKGHDESAGNLPIIVTSSDKNRKYNDSENWIMNRASGTVYEQCFDVVIINRETREIRCVRIGGLAANGVNDSEGTLAEYRIVNY